MNILFLHFYWILLLCGGISCHYKDDTEDIASLEIEENGE